MKATILDKRMHELHRLVVGLQLENRRLRLRHATHGECRVLMSEGKWVAGVTPVTLASPPREPRDPYRLQRPFMEFRKRLAERATALGFKWQAEQLETAALRLWEQQGGK